MLAEKQTEETESLLLSFVPVQFFSGLDEVCPYQGKGSALLCLLIQMLVSSRNTFTGTE